LDPVFRQTLARHGAVFNLEDAIDRFGDAEAELRAAFDSCVLAERSDLTRLVGNGPDLLPLLNRLSTGAVADLDEGEGRPTVLTTPKGRIVDRLFVHRVDRRKVLLVGGRDCGERVLSHIARYTFAERTELSDATAETVQFVLIGPASERALSAVVADPPAAHHVLSASLAGQSVHILGQDGFAGSGYSIVAESAAAGVVWDALVEALGHERGVPAGRHALESYRLLRGIPTSGHELTEEHNPLEAGLEDAVSFDKGCYVGQEVVARLNTYEKVSRLIVGLEFPGDAGLPETGTPLLLDGRTVGALTSAIVPPGSDRAIALAYVKRKEMQAGISVELGAGGPSATLVELPFER